MKINIEGLRFIKSTRIEIGRLKVERNKIKQNTKYINQNDILILKIIFLKFRD